MTGYAMPEVTLSLTWPALMGTDRSSIRLLPTHVPLAKGSHSVGAPGAVYSTVYVRTRWPWLCGLVCVCQCVFVCVCVFRVCVRTDNRVAFMQTCRNKHHKPQHPNRHRSFDHTESYTNTQTTNIITGESRDGRIRQVIKHLILSNPHAIGNLIGSRQREDDDRLVASRRGHYCAAVAVPNPVAEFLVPAFKLKIQQT